jgi:carbonic anhydrase
MNKTYVAVLAVTIATCLTSWGYAQDQLLQVVVEAQAYASDSAVPPRVERVLTKEERDLLKPAEVVQILKDGNGRFAAGTLTSRDHSKMVREAALGQYPKAVILSCVDSRIPVEDVFDRGIGDVFVARVAGNFENVDILGSMEFSCRVTGAKVVLVLGHEHCGAIKSAIDNVQLGNITAMLQNIRPAVEFFHDYEGDKTSKNQEFVHMVVEQNIRMTMDRICERSPILREMEAQGELKIIGGHYDMTTGVVTFFER